MNDIHRQVMSCFIYTPDLEAFGVPDYWSSFADDVEQGKTFRGDCDNFALTCAELAHRQSMKDISIALCWTETGEYHAVCFIGTMCLDNRQRRALPIAHVPYVWDKSMRLDEPGVWRELKG